MSVEDETPSLATLVEHLRELDLEGVRLALVLGSGLGSLVEQLSDAISVPYAELLGMPQSRVPGHAGRLTIGHLGETRVLLQQGRVHLYEGWSGEEVTRAVRAFAAVGLRGLILTNAAGSLHTDWPPGTLVRLEDHVNLQSATPLFSGEGGRGCPYDAGFAAELDGAAAESDVGLRSGTYAANLGPAYETPAEVRMLGRLGVDLVGMSTAAEATAAHAAGMRVAAVSCVSNLAAGVGDEPLSHAEVIEAGRAAAAPFARLLECALGRMHASLERDANELRRSRS